MSAIIHSFITEFWKLDGGSCFGVIPKSIWNKESIADKDNLIDIASRCLLIECGERKIVIDTGIGNKFDTKFYSYFQRSNIKSVATCVKELGYSPEEITDVIFTHLHWDHIGGASYITPQGDVELFFKNATHWCSTEGLKWAQNHSIRERKAFFKEDIEPLTKSKKLKTIESDIYFCPEIELKIYNGHTIGQIIPFIKTGNGTVVFAGDFIPSKAHLPIIFVPSQDIQPLVTMAEKEQFLVEALEKQYIILFQHDFTHECCQLKRAEKGIIGGESFTLNQIRLHH